MTNADDADNATDGTVVRKSKAKPGERRMAILQAFAAMLEQPMAERVTTAALAKRLDVSEAALYRHFASKAQMFEGLIEFIETSIFSLLNQIAEKNDAPSVKARHMVTVLLQFAQRNPGMARVMVGDALVFENDRLEQRMNQFFERIESALRQVLRASAEARHSPTPTVDANARAAAMVALALGNLQRFARSGFKRSPLEHLDVALKLLIG